MLVVGDRVSPQPTVWTTAGERTTLGEVIGGLGDVLLCFYPFDWSPG